MYRLIGLPRRRNQLCKGKGGRGRRQLKVRVAKGKEQRKQHISGRLLGSPHTSWTWSRASKTDMTYYQNNIIQAGGKGGGNSEARNNEIMYSHPKKTVFSFCLMLRLKTGGRETRKRQRGGLKGKIEFVVLWSNENKWSSLCCEQRDLFICEIWLIHMRDIAHLYEWHDSFVWVTWLMTCELACYLCVTWPSRIHIWWLIDVWHDSLVWVTWLIRMSDMTHSYEWHDS